MTPKRFPPWLKVQARLNERYSKTQLIIKENGLHTVCDGAACPNRGVCYAEGTATFMILGNVCTRNCRFCNVDKGKPMPLDPDEPRRVALAVQQLKLDYVVITSVTRDDLNDGGAAVFGEVIKRIRLESPNTRIEVLTPDFKNNQEALLTVAAARPDVFNHNIETVSRLYPEVRPQADYHQSLAVLKKMKKMLDNAKTKSGIMVGLGETKKEMKETLMDLRSVNCDFVTIGQYLSPSKQHLPVVEYIKPEVFDEYRELAYSLGFSGVASGPLVRSSYHAKEMFGEPLQT